MMDPDLVMRMMDPAVRNNPAELRRLSQETRRAARLQALRSVRLNGLIMQCVGLGMTAGGLAAAAFAVVRAATLRGWPGFQDPAVFVAVLLTAMGAMFVVFGRMFGVPSPMQGGVPATARVKVVRSLGRSIGIRRPGLTAVLTKINLVFSVQPPDGPAVDVPHSEFVIATDLRLLQVGATVPVRIAPGRPHRMAIAWEQIVER
jgi:hypothetical protein